jgi:putative DNA primase/helicase
MNGTEGHTMTLLDAALRLIDRGFYLVPVPFREKKPVLDSWQNLRIGKADASQYFNGQRQNVGIILGAPYGETDVDCDCCEAVTAARYLLPETGMIFGRASKPRSHYFFRSDPPLRTIQFRDPSDKAMIVELRGLSSDGSTGAQTIAPPSTHKETGEAIRYEGGFDGVPANVEGDVLRVAVAQIAAAAVLAKHWPGAGHGRHDCELALAGCLARAGWQLENAERFVLATYRAVPDHDGGALERVRTAVQDTFDKHGRGAKITGFTNLAAAVGDVVAKSATRWLNTSAGQGRPTACASETGAPELLSQYFSDYGNSQRVIALHGADLRYCHALAKWLVWDGRRWAVDDGERARDLAQATILEATRQALAAKNESATRFAAVCLNSQRITNALREAQPHLAIRPVELDLDPDLLNCANGTLELKTGRLREHRREDFITKLVRHDYRAGAKCPIFLAFLKRITTNHPGLMAYLQRAFGYSLTGHTIEKVVFLLHGRGDNGKSTLLAAFLKILGEYGVLLQIDTLMVRQESNNTQADLADLRGARFVMTSETEEGQRLAEGKLKRITQGMGRIKATRKYENPVEFPESHKLWIDANHLPIVRGTDNAIWNRLHPVPFDTTIPKAEQDKELPAKLAAEGEGVLAWAVAGAVQWYSDGLGKPSDVERAGDAWRTHSDRMGRFIAECCITGDFAQAKARALYSAYRAWGEQAGERTLAETDFSNALVERGFGKKHTKTGVVYSGIGLAAETREGDG